MNYLEKLFLHNLGKLVILEKNKALVFQVFFFFPKGISTLLKTKLALCYGENKWVSYCSN